MYRNKTENQNAEDPYQIIRKLRTHIDEQKKQLQEYQMVCDSVMFEKTVAINQISQLKKQVEYLSQRLEQEKSGKSVITHSSHSLFHTRVFSKQNRQNYLTMSPQIGKNDIASSHLIVLNSPAQNTTKKQLKAKQFIPGEVVFTNRPKTSNHDRHISMIDSNNQKAMQNVGQHLIQDFIIISPDVIELKKLREENKNQKQFTIQEFYYVNYNNMYKNRKAQYLKDIAKRSFPLGAIVKKKIIDNIDQFKTQMEFVTHGKMGEQYFIINLKGDLGDEDKKYFLENCNPYKALFAVCLRVPDFIPIKDQKYYQKQEQHVWMVEKVYVILTYYPFFNVHISLLSKIHQKLQPSWYKLQKQEVLSKNLQRNLTEAQKSEEINKLISFLMTKKPDYNQICIHDHTYFGTLPSFGFSSQYVIARFSCAIFFSIFAYEEMLLLVTAIFLQKSIIFVSKSESAATLCSLFLTTVIAPFRYNQHLILNCDSEKVQNIVFQFPFILVASLKKPNNNNFSNILKSFIDNNSDRFKGFNGKDQTAPLILVDIDSNSIFFDSMLNKTFQELIVSPSDSLRDAYLAVNQSVSKSFTFPKKMPVELYTMPKNDYQKNEEIRRKMQKQYQQKIDNNISKWPTYSPTQLHFTVLKLLTEHIQSFKINSDYQAELIKSTMGNNQTRKQSARKHLLSKHPLRQKFVDVLVQSQLFADYLDDLEKKIQAQK